MQYLYIYVGNGRSGQRLVNAVAAGHGEFILFSFDVSQAFVKGLTFEELGALIGIGIRKAELDVPKHDFGFSRQIKGFETFHSVVEVLALFKFIYGLKDAPRALRTALHQVLERWMSCQQLCSEPELYGVHTQNQKKIQNAMVRAREHDSEQREPGETR